jgi:hypothetical protein
MGSKLIEPFDQFPGFHGIGKPPPLGDRRIQVHHMALDAAVKIVKVGVQLAIGHRLEAVAVTVGQINWHDRKEGLRL